MRANVIAPGRSTRRASARSPRPCPRLRARNRHPAHRLGTAADVAGIALFLASLPQHPADGDWRRCDEAAGTDRGHRWWLGDRRRGREATGSEGATVIVADIDEDDARRAVTIAGAGGMPSDLGRRHMRRVAAMFEAMSSSTSARRAGLAAVETLRRSSTRPTRPGADPRREPQGPFLCMKRRLGPMVNTGGGSVILLGSILGESALRAAAYCTSKGAPSTSRSRRHEPRPTRCASTSPPARVRRACSSRWCAGARPRCHPADGHGGAPMGRLGTKRTSSKDHVLDRRVVLHQRDHHHSMAAPPGAAECIHA